MNELNSASPLIAREELENCWRRKVTEAQERYHVATKRYHKALEESHGVIPAENNAVLLTRHEQSEALREFRRILRIFTELTAYGRIPEEESTLSTYGAGQ